MPGPINLQLSEETSIMGRILSPLMFSGQGCQDGGGGGGSVQYKVPGPGGLSGAQAVAAEHGQL